MRFFRTKTFAAMSALVMASSGTSALAKPAADPDDAQPCEVAMTLTLLGPTMKAADNFLACAQVPGQRPFRIVHSRFKRLELLEAMRKRELAQAELVALTTPPLSTLPVFTNTASGNIIIGGEESIGQTQVDLLAARAGYRFSVNDLPAALSFSNKAIALAGYDPALLLDAAPAFALRSRMAYADKQVDVAVKMAVRAFVRGSEDGFVQQIIQSQDAGTQDQLKKLRQYLKDQLGGYPFAISARGRVSQKPEDVARQIKDAKSAAASLEQFERAQLGPL
jgi:hypothetical protein